MLHGVDHVVIAVRNLEAAAAGYTALLGHGPWWRGVHPGAGTANALFHLAGGDVELLAPEGEGPVGRVLGRVLASAGEGLVALALATDDADACSAALRAAGAGAPRQGEGRESGSDRLRRWRTVDLPLDTTRGLMLFAIERGEGPSGGPVAAAPGAAVALDHVVVTTPDLEAARALYGGTLGLRLALDRSFDARGLRILFFRVGGVTVEVVGRLDREPGAERSAGDAASRDAFGGLAYRVPDADAARARLAAAGFDVSSVRDGAKPGTRVCTVRDGTHGVPTLLIQQ